MVWIPQQQIWTQQPQIAVKARSNIVDRGSLLAAYPLLSLSARDVDNKAPIVSVNSPAKFSNGVRAYGKGIVGDGTFVSGSSSGAMTAAGAIPYHGKAEFSGFVIVTFDSLTASIEMPLFRATSSTSTNGIALSLFPNTKLIRALVATTGGTTGWSASYDESATALTAGVPFLIGFSYTSGRRYVVCANLTSGATAVFLRTAITGTIFDSGSASGPMAFGGALYTSGLAVVAGCIHAAAFFGRALTDIEFRHIAQNPWQIFAP